MENVATALLSVLRQDTYLNEQIKHNKLERQCPQIMLSGSYAGVIRLVKVG